MNKLLLVGILGVSVIVGSTAPTYSTTAVVTLAGAKIVAEHRDIVVAKYKRKDCPVCKGKGWYVSGDGISKVDCGYCEEESKDLSNPPLVPIPQSVLR